MTRPQLLRGYRPLVLAGLIDVGVTAWAFAIRDVPTGTAIEATLFDAVLVGALLALGAFKHRGFLYAYPVYAAISIISQFVTHVETSSLVVSMGLVIAAGLVFLYLRTPEEKEANPGARPGTR